MTAYEFVKSKGRHLLSFNHQEWIEMMEEYINLDSNWILSSTDKYFYKSGRYTTCFVEISYWVNSKNSDRKETVRQVTDTDPNGHALPLWTRTCHHRSHLDRD